MPGTRKRRRPVQAAHRKGIMIVPVTERTCARDGCGQAFTPKTARAAYCSDSCRAQAFRSRSRNETEHAVTEKARSPRTRTVAVIAANDPAPTWDPPGEPRKPYQTTEPCPWCEGPLHATPCGTWRVCLACKHRVTPRGVKAPYEHGTQGARQVKNQRERDQEAKALAAARGKLKADLSRMLDDDKLTPESRGLLEWYVAEVGHAPTMARLDDLTEQSKGEKIRHQHFWQGQPEALGAPDYDDEDQDEDYDDTDDYPRAIQAAPAPAVDYDTELAAREWKLEPHGAGICAVVKSKTHGYDYGYGPQECRQRAERAIPGGYVCGSCHDALNRPMIQWGQ
jgi:hypothetical protein